MITPQRLLVVQLADIGDLVLSTPALAALRAAHPTAHLALLTTTHAAPLVQDAGLVDEVLLFDKHAFDSLSALARPHNFRRAVALALRLRRGGYDTLLFFHHFSTRRGALKFRALAWSAGAPQRIGLDNGHVSFLTHALPDTGFGARHQAAYWLELAALTGADARPRPAQIQVGTTPLPPTSKQRIAIHAGSGGYSTARRWEPEHFAQVADQLATTHDAEIILVGAKGDDSDSVLSAMTHPATDLTGRTTLAALAAVLQGCALFVGADSGVMHIAAAVGVPVVAIFGPSNAAAWSPWTPEGKHIVVRSAPECSPCSYVGFGVGARMGCMARTCMRLVTTAQVIAAAEKLLSDVPIPSPQLAAKVGGTQTPTIRILGHPVSVVTYADWMRLIAVWMTGDRPYHVCTVNPEMLMIAQRDPVFRVVLERADVTVPDGVGLLLAAHYRGTPLPERVTGSDGVPLIAGEAARQGWRLFLLGAAPGVAEKAAAVLCAAHPALQIVGIYEGTPAPNEEAGIVARVNASGADILLVAYGAPEQDKWIARNLPRLQVKMAMGVGGTFDFIAGVVSRAPESFRRSGLEWLYRLYLQPWRIRRMMRLPRFALAVVLAGRGGKGQES